MRYALWLASQAGGFLAYFWPISAALAALVLISLVPLMRKHRLERRALLVLMPLLVPTLIIIWGAIFEYQHSRGAEWAVNALYFFLAVELLLCVLVTVRLARYRWLALSCSAASFWVSLGAAFISLMSVSGTWL